MHADFLRDVLEKSVLEGGDTDAMLRHEKLRRYFEAELEVLDHQREILLRMHKAGSFSEESIEKLEQELDVWNMSLREQLRLLD